VEGATHKQVVDLIKSGGDVLTLTVISVTQQVSFCLLSVDYSRITAHYWHIVKRMRKSILQLCRALFECSNSKAAEHIFVTFVTGSFTNICIHISVLVKIGQ
jgi:hypothetical protein